jgi:hypothetical protein
VAYYQCMGCRAAARRDCGSRRKEGARYLGRHDGRQDAARTGGIRHLTVYSTALQLLTARLGARWLALHTLRMRLFPERVPAAPRLPYRSGRVRCSDFQSELRMRWFTCAVICARGKRNKTSSADASEPLSDACWSGVSITAPQVIA